MRRIIGSSIGRKVVSGITGIGLILFVIIHLIGNLLILAGAEPFNVYAHTLTHLFHGAFVYIAEAGLLLFFGAHIVAGVRVYLDKRRARPQDYEVAADAGGASRKTLASRSMLISGIVLFVFVILHLIHFKFGPGTDKGYVTVVDGKEIRDLYRLVVDEFQQPFIAFGYAGVMLLLGLHLRHGFWSALQSLGIGSPRLTAVFNGIGIVLAILLAAGFIVLPIYILVFVDPSSAPAL